MIKIIEQHEIPLSYIISNPSPLPPSDALRLLYVCPFRINGGIRSDVVSVCPEKANSLGNHLWCSSSVVPTFHQGCSGTHYVEHR